MINITVTSSQEHDRKTIAAILEKQEDFRIASLGVDGFDALISAKTHHPDIIIMDFCLSDSTCTDLAPIIRRNSPSTALIVLYSCHEQNVVGKALRAGISGCLPRQGGFDKLPSLVRCVNHEGLYLCQPARNNVLNAMEKFPDYGTKKHVFSFTELRIFFGIALGRTDDEIAESLNMSTGSLRNCIIRIKKKTGLRNRTQITIYALSLAMMSRGSMGQLGNF